MPLLLVFLLFAFAGWGQPLDVLIRGGKLVDGTGNPWRMADVGIRGGRIVEVGNLSGRQATRVIDAKGLVVAPGFIDIHNHSDDTVVTDGNAESMIRQGVTSMIFGEGPSAAPIGGKQGTRVAESRWKDFDGYFALVLKQGISPNIGTYVGSSQIWTYVRGQQAGPPTAAELTEMQDLVRKAMQQGALGVSSSLSGPPGAWIDTATLIAMCKVAGEYGGIYSTHMRTEGNGVFESVAEALEIGRQAGVPVDIIHLKIADHKLWGRMPELVATIRQARVNGQQVEAHVYPYRAGQNNLSSIIPPWAHEGGRDAMLARLQDPKLRDRLRDEIRNGIKGTNWYNHFTATGSWEGMLLVSLSNPEYKKFEGKRMSEVIASVGGDEIDALFKVLLDNKGSVPTIYFHHDEKDMRHALQQPFVSIGSDGTAVKTEGPLAKGHPHPRYYGTFPRVLGRYVRDEKVISLEEAIRKMTSANAAKIGVYDRGAIRPGLWADVTIFNPDTVIDNATWEKPHQYASGIEYVLVNGDLVLAQGKHTNARPGKIIYGAGKTAGAQASDRAAAEWVIRNGGSVKIAGKLVDTLADLPGGDFRLSGVDLIGTIIDPNDMKKLSGLDELTELFLPGPIFNPGAGSRLDINDQMTAFSGLKKLEKLHFSLHFLTNVNIQDKGLAHLKDLTGLRELRLTQSRIKGSGLAPFVNLRKLDLNYSSFTDDGMQYIAGMKELTHLAVRDTLVTDAGLKHVAELKQLEVLDLYGTRITDDGVKHLAGLKQLKKLNLLGATISDDSAAVLATLPGLEELNLYRSQITNAGLAKLTSLKNLRSLDVRYARVTRGGVDDFRRAIPGIEIDFQDSAPQAANASLRDTKPSNATEQAIAQWVMKMGGKATVREGRVREVDLSRTPVSDAQLQHLSALQSLESLNLQTTEVGDAGAAAIGKLRSLRQLNLSHTMTSDKALASFSGLTALESINLSHTLLDGSGLGSLAALPPLRSLSLSGCEVRDDAIDALAAAKNLVRLDLSYSDVTDAGFAKLTALPTLEQLDLTATEIGDAGLKAIASLPKLKRLLINYGRFTDKGIEALRAAQSLTSLEAARSRVTDASVPAIASLVNLRRINLDYTNVSDKAVALLADALPYLESLRLDSAGITDAAVESFTRMKSLKELNLYHTLVTQAAYERIQAALPECTIVYDRESSLPNRRRS
jgi:N-acyl-D-aspartate/D-glutamate deacylase/Leucine-rich repeat (LRR) protein